MEIHFVRVAEVAKNRYFLLIICKSVVQKCQTILDMNLISRSSIEHDKLPAVLRNTRSIIHTVEQPENYKHATKFNQKNGEKLPASMLCAVAIVQ